MKFLVICATLSLIILPSAAQKVPDENRIVTAWSWLTDLCVAKQGFSDLSPAELSAALDKWRRGETQADCQASPPSESPHVEQLDLSRTKLIPSLSDRLIRMADFAAEAQQTPAYVYGIQEHAPAGTASAWLPNPDHGIFSYGGPVHFDELFVPADQRVALCNALEAKTKKEKSATTSSVPSSSNSVPDDYVATRGHCYDEEYLSTARMRDRFARIGSSITLNIRYAQVPLYQSGILIGTDSPSRRKGTGTITGSFDTSKLYRSQTEASTLSDYLQKHNSTVIPSSNKNLNFDLPTVCGADAAGGAEHTAKCIRKFASGGYLQRTFLFFLPVISVKVTSPFDLAKYGTAFIEPPTRSGRSLYDVTLTWNAQKVFPNAAGIASAIKTAKALASRAQPAAASQTADSPPPADQEWRRQVKGLYMELRMAPELTNDDQWWSTFRSTVLKLDKQQPKVAALAMAETP